MREVLGQLTQGIVVSGAELRPLLFQALRISEVLRLVEVLLAAHPRLEALDRLWVQELLFDKLCNLRKSAMLVGVDRGHICVEVWRAGPLVFHCAGQRIAAGDDSSHGAHVAAELILAWKCRAICIAVRAPRAHAQPEQSRQQYAHRDEKRIDDSERVPRDEHPPNVVLGQVHFYWHRRVACDARHVWAGTLGPMLPPAVTCEAGVISAVPRKAQHETCVPLARRDRDEEALAIHDAGSEEAMPHLDAHLLGTRQALGYELNVAQQGAPRVADAVRVA